MIYVEKYHLCHHNKTGKQITIKHQIQSLQNYSLTKLLFFQIFSLILCRNTQFIKIEKCINETYF